MTGVGHKRMGVRRARRLRTTLVPIGCGAPASWGEAPRYGSVWGLVKPLFLITEK